MMKSVQNFISYLHEFLIFFLTFYLFLLRGNMFSGISKNWNFADMWGPPVGLWVATCRIPISQPGQRPSITEWLVIKRARPTTLSTALPSRSEVVCATTVVRTPPPPLPSRVSTVAPRSSPKLATMPHSFPPPRRWPSTTSWSLSTLPRVSCSRHLLPP
jgi:hypothetical protein